MNTLWYNCVVVTSWLAAMGWLISAKVLPSLRIGQPPSYQSILRSQREDPLIGWRVLCNESEIGWALSLTKELADGMTRVDNVVYLQRIPLGELLPKWLQGLLLPSGVDPRQIRLEMDVRSEALFDPLSRLINFSSHVRFPPFAESVRVQGRADEGKLMLDIRYGELRQELEVPLPRSTLFGDTSSPTAKLPGLRQGQRWTLQVYSPFASPHQPVEILEAQVEALDRIAWAGEVHPVWVVVFRSEPGKGASRTVTPRGRLWVRPDGTVLRQEAQILSAKLSFIRLPNAEAAKLAAKFSQLVDGEGSF